MSEGRKALLIILLFFVIMGSFYFYKVTDYNQKILELKTEIQKEEEFIALIDQQLKEIEKKPKIKDVNEFYHRLPSEPGTPQLLQFLEQVSSKNKIAIYSIDFEETLGNITVQNSVNDEKGNTNEATKEHSEKNSEPGIVTISIHMTVSGSYFDLRDFINDVYESERLINLGEWQWAATSTNPMVELTFNTYYSPEMDGILSPLPPIPTYTPNQSNNPI